MTDKLKDIAARVKAGQKVTPDEYVFLLHNDKEALFAFMIANNPGSVNNILRHRLGYTYELGFTPNPQTIQRICQVILERNNATEIQTILDNFQINLDGISPDLKRAFLANKN